jgi:hypothetical protein
MRVLLRNTETGRLFGNSGQWTDSMKEAQDFSSASRAITFASDRGFTGVEVLLSFDDPRYDIRFPLKSRGHS